MASGDTAKFQYLGRVLGTAHNPGYPLYVFVSYAFSHVPIGSLAFRMNLLSALLAAATVGVAYFVARTLGCRRAAAIGAALALGWGRVFWSQALRAEVYSLGALLLAGAVLGLVRWGRDRKPRQLYAAAVCVALALGNHLTIVMVVPGILLYVFLTDARAALRPQTLAVVAMILAVGVAQYGFIVLRSWQGAPYVESRATSFDELIDVLRGAQFSQHVLPFDSQKLFGERAPRVADIVREELHVAGIVLLALGLIRLPRRDTVLLGVGSLGVLVFALNYDVPDLAVFLIPVFVLCSPAIGVGLKTVGALAERLVSSVPVSVATAACLPALLLVTNYRANDHHRRTFEISYFRALFESVPERAAIVLEEYAVDQMVLYKLAGERAAGARDIRLVNRDRKRLTDLSDQGYAIYVFGKARNELVSHGFTFEPVGLMDGARPIDMGPLPLFRLRAIAACADVGNLGWTDVTETAGAGGGRLAVRIDNYRPFDADIVVYGLALARPDVRILAAAGGRPKVDARVFALDADDDRQTLLDALRSDAATLDTGPGKFVSRVNVRVNDGGQAASFMLDLGASPLTTMIRAKVDLNNPSRANLCPDPLYGAELFANGRPTSGAIPLGPEGRLYLREGWHEPEGAPAYFRWTSAPAATLLVPIAKSGDIRLSLEAEPFSYPGRPVNTTIAMSVNGRLLQARMLGRGWRAYEWLVPASAWAAGLNELVIRAPEVQSPASTGVGTDPRALGVAVRSITLHLASEP